MTADLTLYVGTAGWGIPKEGKLAFLALPSQLESYASVFGGVEINSSFYRLHRVSTYRRWAAAVPDRFRFAIKVPKSVTHQQKLLQVKPLIGAFLAEVAGLEGKLGPLLVQFPPSLAFEKNRVEGFFRLMRDLAAGPIACEPRHASWFTPKVDALLVGLRIRPGGCRSRRGAAGWSTGGAG